MLPAAGADTLLVTNLTNVRYLTGFTGSAGQLLVTPDIAVLVTDGRYATQSVEQLTAAGAVADVVIGSVAEQRTALQAAAGSGIIGLEADHATWNQSRQFAELFADATLTPTSGLVEELRRIKDAGELDRIGRAAQIADEALAATLPRLLELPTEREFALELDFAMRRLGADDVSFETIVAAGPNGAKPHARPSSRRISAGELVVIDFGALVDGYHSDMTRTVCIGEPATSRLAEIVEIVHAAQAAGVDAVGVDVPAASVDEACRTPIAAAGYGTHFVHGTGHGVGLDIHEYPLLNQVSAASLAAGFVVTVEPGVYLPDEGGVRIEDSVIVTADGCRRLTNAPKDLVIA